MAWPGWLEPPPPLHDLVHDLMDLVSIPAPPFGEDRRAAFLQRRLQALGAQAQIDRIGNVVSCWGPESGPGLAFFAHIDTALDLGEVVPRYESGRIYGHGTADNGPGVVVLSRLAAATARSRALPARPVYFVANVGEEGLGDLRGIRAFLEDHRGHIGRVVVLDGRLGDIVSQGIASRRLEVTIEAPGGHSWSDFGNPSAVHALGQAIARLCDLRLPRAPRTTLNVGVAEGGTAVNAIAQHARCLIDLRSESQDELKRLEQRVEGLFRELGREPLHVEIRCVGDRPGGTVSRGDPLVQAAVEALRAVGQTPVFACGSTDANAPLGEGIPAICCGVGRGAFAHTPDEWVEDLSLAQGLRFTATLLDILARPA